MTKWDWDRIGSLVDNVDNLIQSARSLHQQGTVADHDTDGLFSFVCSLEARSGNNKIPPQARVLEEGLNGLHRRG